MDFVPQSLTGNRVSANTRPRVRIPPFPPNKRGIPSGMPLLVFDGQRGFEGRVLENHPVDGFPAAPLCPQAGESLPFRQVKMASQMGCLFYFLLDRKDSNGSVVNDCRWQSDADSRLPCNLAPSAAAETESLPRPKIPPVVCVIDKYRRL